MRCIYVFYPDVFLVNNILFNFFMSVFAIQLSKIPLKGRVASITLASIIDSLISVVIIVFFHSYKIYIVWSFIFGLPFLALVSAPKISRVTIKKILGNMYLVTVIFAGTILMFENLFEKIINYMCLIIISFIVTEVSIVTLYMYKKNKRQIYEIEIMHKDKSTNILGLFDSGNRLKYIKDNKPVHIISEDILSKIDADNQNIQIEYKALGTNSGRIDLYKVDKIIVLSGKKAYRQEDVILGKADKTLFEGKEYSMILNGEIEL